MSERHDAELMRRLKSEIRGPLLIHAAKKWTKDLIETSTDEPFRTALISGGVADCDAMPLGCIVGVVALAAVWACGIEYMTS
jgi:hypothetical protein